MLDYFEAEKVVYLLELGREKCKSLQTKPDSLEAIIIAKTIQLTLEFANSLDQEHENEVLVIKENANTREVKTFLEGLYYKIGTFVQLFPCMKIV